MSLLVLTVLLSSCKNNEATSSVKHDGMVLIPGGTLDMGGDNEQADANEFPKHQVSIQSFYMDETEVTNRAFKEFV
ncbi:MAG: SUMF1/EgtB/PvdO family nonheme iron enzyme, partial [Saprospiraceae bacterium]